MSSTDQKTMEQGIHSSIWPIRLLQIIVAVLLFGMAGLTFIDVIGRYVFNAPIPGVFEIIEFMLGLMGFSALPLVTLENRHIKVDLFDHLIRGGFRKFRDLVVLTGSALMIAFIAERMWSTAGAMIEDETISEFLEVSPAPVVYCLSGLSIVTFIILLVMIWQQLKRDVLKA